MPYLPVYYHSLGHGGQIIGMLGAIKPMTTFLVAPFWGLVADQTQAPFKILKVTFLVSLAGQLLVVGNTDFRYIMFMVFITALFNAPVKSLIDSMVMDHINDRSQYGRLRLWGQMGFGLGSSGVGILLSHSKGVISSTATSIPERLVESIAKLPAGLQKFIHVSDKFWQAITGYRLLFLTHAALSIPTWLAITAFQQLDKEHKDAHIAKQPKHKQKKNDGGGTKGAARINEGLNLLIHNGDALLFFFLIFVVGISSGVVENFAYVRMREVGGTGREMGLSRLVSSIAGAPMFWFSGPLTEKLGADRVLVLSLCSYVLRFLIYAFMKHPLQGLPAEALRGITFAAFWSTGTVYAHRISPPGLHATMVSHDVFNPCCTVLYRTRVPLKSLCLILISLVVCLAVVDVSECHVRWLRPVPGSYHWRETAIQGWDCDDLFLRGSDRFMLRGTCVVLPRFPKRFQFPKPFSNRGKIDTVIRAVMEQSTVRKSRYSRGDVAAGAPRQFVE